MLRLQALTSELAARLAGTEPDQVGSEIERGMTKLLGLLKAGRVCWYLKPHDTATLVRMYEVNIPGVTPSPAVVRADELPYAIPRLLRGDTLAVTRLADLPEEAERDRQFLRSFSVQSLALIPSALEVAEKGVLKVTVPSERAWSRAVLSQLEVFSNLIASTFDRKLALAVHAGDHRFRHVVEQAPLGIAVEDLDGRILLVNPALCAVLGYTSDELVGRSCAEFGDAGDSADECVLFQKLRAGLIGNYKLEKRYVRKDGAEVWGRLNVSRINARHVQPPLVVAMLEDVTERRAAVEELKRTQTESRELTRRLIHAQEEERARIGRELHDDIGQRVALLSLELRMLREALTGETQREQHRLASTLCGRVEELAVDLHNLSHTLSSSPLRHLGLGAALTDLCDRVSRQCRVELDLSCALPASAIPPDIALCLFRVAQEALHNVTRHSQASHTFIKLSYIDGDIRLTVRDTGVGFDPSLSTEGIGVAGMRERLRIVGGRLGVQSQPGEGTTIVATVSFKEKSEYQG